jgi:hypothetical protein
VKNKWNLLKKRNNFKKKKNMTCLLVICVLNVWFYLWKVQDLRETKAVMKDVEFDMICIMIYEGRYSPADVPPALDNMFYERFGMSCAEVVNAVARR